MNNKHVFLLIFTLAVCCSHSEICSELCHNAYAESVGKRLRLHINLLEAMQNLPVKLLKLYNNTADNNESAVCYSSRSSR